MITIKEIAKQAGVSIATVSNILNDKPGASSRTKKRVLDIVREFNYTPNVAAKNLKQKVTRTIGIVTEDITVFCTPEIVDGINEACDDYNYQFILGNLRFHKKYNVIVGDNPELVENTDKDVLEELQIMMSKQVDGIVYVAQHSREVHCLPKDFPLPIVLAYAYDDEHECVVTNDEHGAYLATQTLCDMGHDKIGIVCGSETSIHTQERLKGYQKALYNNKILYNPNLVQCGNWGTSGAKMATEALMQHDVTAIFVMSDYMAGGVYNYAQENGIEIGKDLSVIGFDNVAMCLAYNPKLSSMAMPMREIGKKAATLLFDQLENPKNTREKHIYKLNGELINRKSVVKIDKE